MIKINRELFGTLAPKGGRAMMFPAGSVVTIISFNEDAEMEWGTETVPSLTVQVDGVEKEVPAPAILGAVVERPGITHNDGQGALECVDFLNNSLHKLLVDKAEDDDSDIALPSEVKVIKRINKGVVKSQIDGKKEVYEQSFLVEEGKTFDETFKEIPEEGFLPTVFKNATGVVRTNGVYLLESID